MVVDAEGMEGGEFRGSVEGWERNEKSEENAGFEGNEGNEFGVSAKDWEGSRKS